MTAKIVRNLGIAAALLALLCLPAFAEEDVIKKGIDIWSTPGDGFTFSNFGIEPIPAGFFCEGSAPFTGKIQFRGVPVNTFPEGALGQADTVIERLDDAEFDASGSAFTRVRFAALQMESVEPVETDCGFFDVSVSLSGQQPVTSMRITRLDKSGGFMDTILSGNVDLTFTPVGRDDAEPRVFTQSFRFSSARGFWQGGSRTGFRQQERISLDSDGDGEVDREVLGLSNFAAGSGRQFSAFFRTDTVDFDGTITPIDVLPQPDCHCASGQSGFVGAITCLTDPDPETGCLHLHCPEPIIDVIDERFELNPGIAKKAQPNTGLINNTGTRN